MNTTHEVKILMLEDRPADAEMILREVSREGFRFVAKRVMTEAELKAELQNPEIDLILSDFKLPSYDGISALMLVRRTRPEVPFIMVSGSMGEEIAINTLHLGATDYVLKHRISRLGPAVRRALRESKMTKNEAQSESLIRHLHEVLRAVRDVDELIVRERNPEKLLAEACKILVRTRGYRVVWIGLVQPDSKRVVPVASAGPAADYATEITVTWDETKTGRGPVGTAIRRRETCVFQDLAEDARFGPWQEKALARGCHSVAAVPMTQGDCLFGSLNVYADRPNAFDREELLLLKELADDLSFALQSIEVERQRRQVEEALRASEEKYRVLFESSRDAMMIATPPDWKFSGVNPATLQMFGVATEAAFCSLAPWDISPERQPDGRLSVEKSKDMIEAALREGSHYFEWTHKRLDGKEFPATVLLTRFLLAGQMQLHATVRDITGQKRAEAEMARLATAVEQAAETIVITDTTGTVLYANPAFERITGYTRAEAVGQNPRVLKSGKHDDAFYRQMWDTLGRGEVWHGRFINKKKDGTLYEEDASITPIRDAAGVTVNYVAVKRDVTQEVVLEAQLRDAQKMEALGTLASGVAHEINNPINGIMNYAQLIADELPAESHLQKFTRGIKKETDRVSTIVRNLLAFARQDKHERALANPADMIKAVLTLIQTVIRRDQITMTVDVPEGLPPIGCRGQQIEQVLMNLLTNARDALNEKYPGHHENKIIRVSALLFEKDGEPWIRMTVEDHGTGIPQDIRNRVFDPFYTTKPVGKGTGLGLSISHGIVTEHSGELYYETEAGQHTCFHLNLPVKQKNKP